MAAATGAPVVVGMAATGAQINSATKSKLRYLLSQKKKQVGVELLVKHWGIDCSKAKNRLDRPCREVCVWRSIRHYKVDIQQIRGPYDIAICFNLCSWIS